MSGKLETVGITGRSPWARRRAELRSGGGRGEGCGRLGRKNLTGKPSCDLLRLPPDGLVSRPVGSLPSQQFHDGLLFLWKVGQEEGGETRLSWTPPLPERAARQHGAQGLHGGLSDCRRVV